MNTTTIEIKTPSPCPLCGHPPQAVKIHDEYLVECSACPGPDAECRSFPIDVYNAKVRLVDALRTWELQCLAEKHKLAELRGEVLA